jgi:hypothetical protein
VAIATEDQLLNGLQPPEYCLKASFTGVAAGNFHSSVYLAGRPGAMTAPSSGLSGATVTSSRAGMLPLTAAVAGLNIYLAGLDACQAGNVGAVLVVDRLWDNSGISITTTTSQAITSSTWPARDASGSTNGAGILVGLEVSSTLGNGAVTNTTLGYTSSAGTAGRTGTIASFPAAAPVGTFVPFSLNAGDVGIRSIQTLTLGTSYVSGTMNLVAYRVLAVIGTPTANVAASQDFLQLGMPRIYDSSALQLLYLLSGTAGGAVQASINYTQG